MTNHERNMNTEFAPEAGSDHEEKPAGYFDIRGEPYTPLAHIEYGSAKPQGEIITGAEDENND